ncbi:catalase family protein [Acinetobacter sp.]|uniref:catalase family protein n=1 Tax=Acinetobacter sp. TaxID=472 RepID=UPI003FCDDEF3
MPDLKLPIRFSLISVLASMLMAISGCAVPHAKNIALNKTSYPGIDPVLGESLYPNEEAIAEEIADAIERSIRKQYSPGNALRDAHPKAHGCVRAEFHVLPTLPNRLAKGVFIPGKTYQAWIRFSNGSRDAAKADIKRDARGMAIKLLAVPGKKIIDGEAATQDFIMINHPVFFANEPGRYRSLIQDINSDSFLKKLHIPFALGPKGTMIALSLNTQISNPLQARYWSMVPYQLGLGSERQAVKYSARACSAERDLMPEHPSHNFLRDALKNSLQKKDACMEFLVQPRTSNKLSVEDSMTEWKETDAPFYPVAVIRIPEQVFDTPDQNKFCENLSFMPWHSLPEHKPLGAVNRLRKVIYDRISRVRHEMNTANRQEPL